MVSIILSIGHGGLVASIILSIGHGGLVASIILIVSVMVGWWHR